MQKVLILLLLAAVVAIASAATKEELMAKKWAFKKGKGKADTATNKQDYLIAIKRLKDLNLSPDEFRKRVAQLKQGPAAKKPGKTLDSIDMNDVIHKKKVTKDRERAAADLKKAERQFRQDFAQVRHLGINTKEKQRKMIGMKQDFMAGVSDLKERMGYDTQKTDRMAWKQAQLKNRRSIILD